jgi:hypothetical protein
MRLNFKHLISSVLTEHELLIKENVDAPPAENRVLNSKEEGEEKKDEPSIDSTKARPLTHLFFEVDEKTTPATDENATFTPKGLSQEMRDVNTVYEQAYGPSSAPTSDTLNKMLNIWMKCWTRTSASQFYNYVQYLPYIELMAQVANLAPGNPSSVVDRFKKVPISIEAFKKQLEQFKKTIQNRTSANPIDFPIITAEGQYVATQLRKQIQQNTVGQVALEKFSGNSIKEAIFYILEARKKARLASLPTKSVPDQGKEVLDVLLHPEKYSGGMYAFSNKVSSDKIYTRAMHTDLLNIGFAAKALFESELHRIFPKDESSNFKSPGPITGDTAYEVFLNNASQEEGNLFAFDAEEGHVRLAKDVGAGGYSIENLKKLAASSENEPARELYNLLTSLANYVREGEIIDWNAVAGGIGKLATGLSFGAPTVGGKRS